MDRSTEIQKWEIRGIMSDFQSADECDQPVVNAHDSIPPATSHQNSPREQDAQDETNEIQIIEERNAFYNTACSSSSLLDENVEFTEEELKILKTQLEKVFLIVSYRTRSDFSFSTFNSFASA